MSSSEPSKKKPGAHRRNGRADPCPVPHLVLAPPYKRAVARMARNEANQRLGSIYQATKEAQRMKELVATADWAGDLATKNAVEQALRGLAAAAAV